MDDEFDDPETFAALQAVESNFRASSSGQNGRLPSSNVSAPAAPKVQQPTPQALPQRALPSAVLVSPRQKGNPILSHITSMPWEYTDTPADYVLGATTCALFLSLKYHRLHPEYIYGRIRGLAGKYNLRVLLTMVDIDNHEEPLRELAKTSLINNLTLMLCWSAREAARYLEAYKSFERADAGAIKGAKAASYAEHMQEFVTTPRGVNKTDAISLVSNFGSIRNAVNAEREEIVIIPGWGEKKVERFVGTVNETFRIGRATKKVGRDRDGAGAGDEVRRIGTLRPDELSSLGASRGSRGTPEAVDRSDNVRKRARESTSKDHPQSAVPAWEPGEDEEEALLMSEVAPPTVTAPVKDSKNTDDYSQAAARNKPKEPQLSDGIEAALAKLRK